MKTATKIRSRHCSAQAAEPRLARRERLAAWILQLVVLLLCSTIGPPAHAQFDTASVLGKIADPSGAAIVGASVTLTNPAKGTTAKRLTDSTGNYEFAEIQPGRYQVSVVAAGFEKATTDPFTVNVGARQRVALSLKLGSTANTVVVSGAAALLQTASSDRGETIGGTEAVALPLNGRAYADLSILVPGVSKSLDDSVVANPPRDASYNVNGLTSQANNFELDGIDNNAYQEANQGFSNQAVIPSPDAIQEFKVQTDNYSAEYGRAGGAIINVTTRSGSNTFHGGVYDYLRNTTLNAYGPFQGTGVKPTLVQNQFGGTLGGPIRRTKLFFFVDFEGLRSSAHTLTTAVLPTAAELTGLFTSDGSFGGKPVPIKNPYTGAVYANGQVPLNDQNIDPLALSAFKLLPTPNIVGVAPTANNYQYLPATTDTDSKGDGRVDFYPNSNQNGFFRYSQRSGVIFQPAPFPGDAGGNSSGTLYAQTRQIAAGYNWALSPSSSLQLRFGQTWTESGKRPVFLGAPNLLAGIPNVPQDPAYTGGLNTQSVTGYTQFGEQSTSPQFTNPTQANPRVNYTWIRGAHSLKAGYEYGWLSQAISDFHPKFGADTYAGQYSSAGSATSVQAANLTDFLFGARSNYSLNAPNEVNYLRFWHMAYIQDDWQALSHLTLNLGLRYEFMSPNYEQNNNILNYDPVNQQLLHAGAGQDVASTTPGHVYTIHYVGGNSLASRALVNPDYDGFAPRFGFAFQPRPATVIKGGFGISYSYLFRFGGEGLLAYNGPNNYSATLPVNQAPNQGVCTSLTEDPTTCFRRTQDGYQTDFAGPANFSTTHAQTRYQPEDFKNPYVQSFYLAVEQQLPENVTLDVAYVGSHAVHIPALEDFNQARLCSATEIANGSCSSTGAASLLNRRPIPNFTDILTETNEGFLSYNSLQTKLVRQFDHGIFMTNAFTWSRGINNSSADLEANDGDSALINRANPEGDRGPSGYNQPLNDTTSFIADLPYGRGARWGSHANGFEQEILGGWQLTGINVVTSGVPINVTYTANSNQVVSTTSAAYSLRPNIAGGTQSIYGSSLAKSNSAISGYLNAASLSAPSGSQLFGTLGRNALRGPAYGQFDLAAHKNFPLLSDRQNLEFRIEAFDVFNATNYIAPNTNIGSVGATGVLSPNAAFGTFSGSSEVFPSREVQFALRLSF